MTLHTRRHVLSRSAAIGVSASVSVALAGCADTDSERSTDSITEGTLPEEDVFLPDELEVRRLWFDTDETELLDDQRDDAPRLPYLTDSDHATEVEFPTDPVDAETDDPVGFLQEIEYEEAVGLAVESRTPACYEDAVQYVEWRSDTRLGVQLCQTLRDADVSCAEGEEYTQLTLIEVPTTIKGGPTGSGQGWSHQCSGRPDSSEGSESEDGVEEGQ